MTTTTTRTKTARINQKHYFRVPLLAKRKEHSFVPTNTSPDSFIDTTTMVLLSTVKSMASACVRLHFAYYFSLLFLLACRQTTDGQTDRPTASGLRIRASQPMTKTSQHNQISSSNGGVIPAFFIAFDRHCHRHHPPSPPTAEANLLRLDPVRCHLHPCLRRPLSLPHARVRCEPGAFTGGV